MKLEPARKLYESGRTDELLDLRNLPGGLEGVVDTITGFIKSKTTKGVIGISGGVDSALIAALSVRALGKENVYGLIMPSATSTPEETTDAIAQAEKLGIKYSVINIQDIVDAYSKVGFMSDVPWGERQPSTLGNAKPRMRMTLLYGWANQNGGMVIGTDNKTEGTDHGVGYFTKFGDGGVDMNPIGGLYKTQVWQLSEHVEVLPSIVKRPPTAGLRLGQTDEGELGISYRALDKVLLGIELCVADDTIAGVAGASKDKIAEIRARQIKNAHKGEMPPSVAVVKYESQTHAAHKSPIVTVDAIIKYNDKYVFVRRGREPFNGMFAFPGGHVEYEKENCEAAAVREAKEETGLDFKIHGLLGVWSNPDRDPRGHYATLVFFGEGTGTPRAGDDASEVILLGKPEVKNLAFDHNEIWEAYLKWVGK